MSSEEDKIIRSVENVISAVGQLVGDIRGASDIDGRSKAFALERVSSLASDLDQINRALFLNELPENFIDDALGSDGDEPELMALAPVAEAGGDLDVIVEREQSDVGDENVVAKPRLVLTPVAAVKAEEFVKNEAVLEDVGVPDVISSKEMNDLTLIDGIDDEVVELLHGQDVFNYSDIAAFKEADMLRFSDLLSDPCRVSRQNWIEQAALLAAGGQSNYAMAQQGQSFYDRKSWLTAYENSSVLDDGDFVEPIGLVPPVVTFDAGSEDEIDVSHSQAGTDDEEFLVEEELVQDPVLSVPEQLVAQEDQEDQIVDDEYIDDDELTQIILARKQELEAELRQLREKQTRQQQARDERVKEELASQGKFDQVPFGHNPYFQDQVRHEQAIEEPVGFVREGSEQNSDVADIDELADLQRSDEYEDIDENDELYEAQPEFQPEFQPVLKEQEYRQSVDAFVEELSRSSIATMVEPESGVNELVAARRDEGGAGDGLHSDVEAIWHEEVSTAADYVPPVVDDEDEYGADGDYASDHTYVAGEQYFAQDDFESQKNGIEDYDGNEEFEGDAAELPYGKNGDDYSESDIAFAQSDIASSDNEVMGQAGIRAFSGHFASGEPAEPYEPLDEAVEFVERSELDGLEFEINEPRGLNGDRMVRNDEAGPEEVAGIHFEADDGVGFFEEDLGSKPLGAYLAKSVNGNEITALPGSSVSSVEPSEFVPGGAPDAAPSISISDSISVADLQVESKNGMPQKNISQANISVAYIPQNEGGDNERYESRQAVLPPAGPPQFRPQVGTPSNGPRMAGGRVRDESGMPVGIPPYGAPNGGQQGGPIGGLSGALPMAPPLPPQRSLPLGVVQQGSFQGPAQGVVGLGAVRQDQARQDQARLGIPINDVPHKGRGPQGAPPQMMPPQSVQSVPPQGMMPPPAPNRFENRSVAGAEAGMDDRNLRSELPEGQDQNGHMPQAPNGVPISEANIHRANNQGENYQGGGHHYPPRVPPIANEHGGRMPAPMPPRRSRVVRSSDHDDRFGTGEDEGSSNGTWSNYWGDSTDEPANQEPTSKLGFREKAKKFAQSLQRNFTDDNE